MPFNNDNHVGQMPWLMERLHAEHERTQAERSGIMTHTERILGRIDAELARSAIMTPTERVLGRIEGEHATIPTFQENALVRVDSGLSTESTNTEEGVHEYQHGCCGLTDFLETCSPLSDSQRDTAGSCGICLIPFSECGVDKSDAEDVAAFDASLDDNVVILPCPIPEGARPHAYHGACISQWLHSNPTCPECRTCFICPDAESDFENYEDPEVNFRTGSDYHDSDEEDSSQYDSDEEEGSLVFEMVYEDPSVVEPSEAQLFWMAGHDHVRNTSGAGEVFLASTQPSRTVDVNPQTSEELDEITIGVRELDPEDAEASDDEVDADISTLARLSAGCQFEREAAATNAWTFAGAFTETVQYLG